MTKFDLKQWKTTICNHTFDTKNLGNAPGKTPKGKLVRSGIYY